MSNTGYSTTNHPVQNQIPSDLIPTTRNKITLDYASEKLEWACILNPSKFQQLRRTSNPANFVAEWKDYMIKIQTELQELGHNLAMQKVVSVFSDDYEIHIPGTNQKPTSFDDVLNIIANKEWYNAKKQKSYTIIWMVMYGIFRRSFDTWLMNAANEWKVKNNIQYTPVFRERQSTGFVHQNMLQKASTLIQRQIRNKMKHHHSEELCCKKKKSSFLSNYTESQIFVNGCPVYLYSSIHEDDVLNQIRNTIKSAFEANVDRPLIENCIQNVLKEYDSQSENTQGE